MQHLWGFLGVCFTGLNFGIFYPCLKMQGSLSSVLGVLPDSENSQIPGKKLS